jgi:alkanesulfonate monooxygenase SsuD/methylene tetrahydromethanopterin reductase-like flavin-dependent oxidoreductase (luciferase family)
MKIGLFVTLETEAAMDTMAHLRDIREQVRTARDAGFASLWLPQHFIVGPTMRQFAASPMLGFLAGMAEGMTLGTAVLLLPMLNPVLLAEEAATLDHLTDGKFVLGVGLGYRDGEFAAMGIERRSRVSRFREYVEAMRRLWAGDHVTWHGKYVRLDNVSLSLRPRNPKGIPVWVGGTVEDAVKRAAEIGDSWQGAGAMTLAEMKRWWGVFHETRTMLGKPLDYPRQVSRECFCGPSMAAAVEMARGPISAKYARYAGHGFGGFDASGGEAAFRQFAQDRFVVGDEAYVRDELQRYRDELGATEFRFRLGWPGLPQQEVLAGIRRLGRVATSL